MMHLDGLQERRSIDGAQGSEGPWLPVGRTCASADALQTASHLAGSADTEQLHLPTPVQEKFPCIDQ